MCGAMAGLRGDRGAAPPTTEPQLSSPPSPCSLPLPHFPESLSTVLLGGESRFLRHIQRIRARRIRVRTPSSTPNTMMVMRCPLSLDDPPLANESPGSRTVYLCGVEKGHHLGVSRITHMIPSTMANTCPRPTDIRSVCVVFSRFSALHTTVDCTVSGPPPVSGVL